MEFTIPVPEINLNIIGQFRFYADRHMIVITDTESQSHGTLLQVDATIDDTIGTELNDINAFAEDPITSINKTSNNNSHGNNDDENEKQIKPPPPPLAIEITPLLGSERDNQWALLVARRLTTVVAEALLMRDGSGKASSSSVLSAPSPVRNFSVSVVMMVHVPLAFKKSENMKYAMDVVKKLESKVRETLMG